MRTLLSLILIGLQVQTANASDLALFLLRLSQLNKELTAAPAKCGPPNDSALPGCSDITDNFCRQLWSQKNNGNMKVFDGVLLTGKSPKSKLRHYEIANYRALADCLPNLPDDLKATATPILKNLGAVLAKEENSAAWRRKVADLKLDFDRAVTDVATARQKATYSQIMAKEESMRTPEESFRLDAVQEVLEEEVLDAKYDRHPNWLRVKKVYDQAKTDLLETVTAMQIPSTQKEALLEKLSGAELTLPYTSDGGLNAEDDCANTTVNAYYFPGRNQLVVCAGLFNSYQSEAALYMVLAHELSHSIDTNRQAEIDYQTHSPVARLRPRLMGKPGTIACDEWEKLKESSLKQPEKFLSRYASPLDKLNACLKNRADITEVSTEKVRASIERDLIDNMNWYASRNRFVKIAQPTISIDGERRPNPYYMRPDLFGLYMEPPYGDGKTVRDVNAQQIFGHELYCRASSKANGFASFGEIKDPQKRNEIFKSSIAETQKIMRAIAEDNLAYCGPNCPELVNDGMAVNANENSADWFAKTAIPRFFDRYDDVATKREASAITTSLFCSEPGVEADAPDLALIEKSFSTEAHGDNRERRVSLYSSEVAGTVYCAADPDAKGLAECSP